MSVDPIDGAVSQKAARDGVGPNFNSAMRGNGGPSFNSAIAQANQANQMHPAYANPRSVGLGHAIGQAAGHAHNDPHALSKRQKPGIPHLPLNPPAGETSGSPDDDVIQRGDEHAHSSSPQGNAYGEDQADTDQQFYVQGSPHGIEGLSQNIAPQFSVLIIDSPLFAKSAMPDAKYIAQLYSDPGTLDLVLAKAKLSGEEIALVNTLRASGNSPEDIVQALYELRVSQSIEGYDRPGTAFTRNVLPQYNGLWLSGLPVMASLFPAQLALKLQGQSFDNFAAFRQTFWKAVADTSELAYEFSKSNVIRMQSGMAPIAPASQHWAGRMSYVLVHHVPVSQGGSIYDMSNILVLTPLMLQMLTNPRYQTALDIMYSGHLRMRSARLKRRELARRYDSGQQIFGPGKWLEENWRRFKHKRKSKFMAGPEKQVTPSVLTGSVIPPDRSKKRASNLRRKMTTPPVLTQRPLPTALIGQERDYLSFDDLKKELLS